MEFLKLYEMHPCIWDPKNALHKSRNHLNDAWKDINKNLRVANTIQDLKKKKESLMAAYRFYKTKIKKSKRLGSTFDVYKPSWFAFPIMDSFLGSVYTSNTAAVIDLRNERTDSKDLGENSTKAFEAKEPNDSNPILSNQESSSVTPTETADLNDSNPTSSNQEPFSITRTSVKKRQRSPPELLDAKRHMEQAFNFMKKVQTKFENPDDECTIFGQLIAKKIRKLSDERRDIMMVKINQLFVDENMLESLKRSPCSSSAHTHSPQRYQEVFYQTNIQAQTEEMYRTDDLFEASENKIPIPDVTHNHVAASSVGDTVPAEVCGTRKYILPYTICDGTASTKQDFIIIKEE